MAYSHELVTDCLQFERAFCSAECPFNLDIRDFAGKLQQGRFNVAYKTYQNVVGFPGIVTALCPEPCKKVCPMKDAGGPISLKWLEKASMDHARNKEPDQYNMPPKNKKIAIIGAGISGLACALRLSTKKYPVTVFEKSDRIGGHLYDLLDPEIFLEDIKLQFKYEIYQLYTDTEITDIDVLDFDAIYIATGKNGNDFGLSKGSEGLYATSRQGVFIGGSITGADTMKAIAHGLNVSNAIEAYLKIGKMSFGEEISGTTRLKPEAIRKIPKDPIIPADGCAYSKDEAIAEAKRCLKCCCDACVHYSPLMNYFQKFPRRITEEVEITIHPSSLDGNATLATRLISTCNHCGLCKEVCPVGIDVGKFLLKSHRTMHETGKMPWAFHEFYLRDMEFSNGEAGLVKAPHGYDKCRFMFFPGCQLGASDMRYVSESYNYMTKYFPDTALMLRCCGAPADWAGDEKIHSGVIDAIKADWSRLGKPTAVFACPMCKQMFGKYLPEIQGRFLYEFFIETETKPVVKYNSSKASVYDPCASRYEPDLQQIIRNIASNAGFILEPLVMEKNMAECCSYGGQVAIAHPPYVNYNVEKRIRQNDNPYITYCSNCRDIFTKAGKQCWHILDIMFGLNREHEKILTISERRQNRLHLKQQLLKEYWNETFLMENNKKQLIISPELREKLNKEMILETDIFTVIEYCEQSGQKLLDSEAGTYAGHRQIGNMTFWVEYRIMQDGSYELLKGYCHRMKIEDN